MSVRPMFPLGSVLLPSLLLPLHIFEPRYRVLVHDCLTGDHEFGVVLITRGSEVGGGETREAVGTMARIVEAAELPDGRWAVGAVGVRRIRVQQWLDDDPYPRAEVQDWPDPDVDLDSVIDVAPVVTRLRRVLAQRAELGDSVAASTHELSDDPVIASYQAVALSPFGPADHQMLLAMPSARARLDALGALLIEEEEFVGQRLALDAQTDGHGPDDVEDR